MVMSVRRLLIGTALASELVVAPAFAQEETIKVGVLHSLSGTKAISERPGRT